MISSNPEKSAGPWEGTSSAERQRLLAEKMDSLTPAEIARMVRKQDVLSRRYGMGNHGPDSEWHDPMEAFQMSKSISYPHAQYRRWLAFFRGAAISRQYDHLMDDEERARLASLPARVTVYRGIFAHDVLDQHGFSWTLDRDQAEWFAGEYWKSRFPPCGFRSIVLTEEVEKSRIIWLLLGRNENEVVLAPPLD